MLAALAIVAAANLLLHEHWEGGIHGIIGFDFMAFYSSGKLYWNQPQDLYNFEAIADIEQALIAPTSLGGGVNIFAYPPYVAMVCGALTLIPYPWAMALWGVFSLLSIFISANWITKYLLPSQLTTMGINAGQFFIITLAFFPSYIGLINGQNHAITLLLLTGIVIFSMQEKWELAGSMAGLLIYKPQFVIGFLIVWILWRKYRAIIPFLAISIVWATLALATKGLDPYLDYLNTLPQLFMMPFGVARRTEITLPALIATLLGPDATSPIRIITFGLTIAASLALAILAWKFRNHQVTQTSPVFAVAILYPILISPHALIYDLIVLVLVFALWARTNLSSKILWSAVCVYLTVFFLPPISQIVGISLLALIPTWVLVGILTDLVKKQEPLTSQQ